ncbi:MAG: hypothetical protein GXO62_02910 [Epsilonproteobacteria bacterium]|nr:hypothetical protein [Campylobacterota bacterium]
MAAEVLNFYLDTVEKKLGVLLSYKEKLAKLYSIPLKDEYFEEEDLMLEELLDAIVYKFNKIQSIISEKLFAMVLEYVGINSKGFLEILSALEKEEILEIKKWRKLREMRNKIVHDYPQEIEEMVEGLNELLENIEYLQEVFYKLKDFKQNYELLENKGGKE